MNKLLFLILSLALISTACKNEKSKAPVIINTGFEAEPLVFSSDSIRVEGELGSFEVKISSEQVSDGIIIVNCKIESAVEAVPPVITLSWNFPSIDIYSFWNPNISTDKVTFYSNSVVSRGTRYAPVMSFMSHSDINRFTVACSEVRDQVSLSSYLKEEDANFYIRLKLFDEKMPAILEYEFQIRIDLREYPYYEVLDEVSDWWAEMEDNKPAPVPDAARWPMYSTWYSFHQNLVVDDVINECRIASKLGMKAVIVDDGWQTNDNRRGYAYTGDWEPERIPEMKAFVDSIHNLDMKFLLWYSVPFMGKNAKNYTRFKGKYLRYWESQGAWVLDPRYPEVREYIISTYVEAMKNWGLDGFKLDFMAWFSAVDDTDLSLSGGRDFASVNEAADHLMTDILGRLYELNPEIMIEFRQPYTGPLMRKYGNLFRAVDCGGMAVLNRVRIADVRLIAGNTAPHSDMVMWHPDEPVESAALQVLNLLFGVPQISMKLVNLPEDHLEMIAFWMDYWGENREILLDGKFIPSDPDALYPLCTATTRQKTIVGIYNNVYPSIDGGSTDAIDLINAREDVSVILDLTESFGKANIYVLDCLGKLQYQDSQYLGKGSHKFLVPPSGMLQIRKK